MRTYPDRPIVAVGAVILDGDRVLLIQRGQEPLKGEWSLPGGAVELVAYAHSIDFGAKGYGNLVELASLQRHVAGQLGLPAGRLLMIVKSAHVYETERGYLRGVLAEAR